MTIEECKKLKKGDKVYINLGNGYVQIMEFIRLTKVTSFGKMTISDLMSGNFNISKGKEEINAYCKYRDDRGRELTKYCRPRAIHKAI